MVDVKGKWTLITGLTLSEAVSKAEADFKAQY